MHPKYLELLTGEENIWIYYADIEDDYGEEVPD